MKDEQQSTEKRGEERDFESKDFVTSSLAKVGLSVNTRKAQKTQLARLWNAFNFKAKRHVGNRASLQCLNKLEIYLGFWQSPLVGL